MRPSHTLQLHEIPKWLPTLALLIVLYLMYSGPFLSDYLMQDERHLIGRAGGTYASEMSESYYGYGRALFGLYQKLVYEFVAYSPVRIQFVRFLNFAAFACIAAFLLHVLGSIRNGNRWPGLLIVLFFMSQLPIQGAMGYSLQLVSNTVPSISLSLLAFYLNFFVFPKTRVPRAVEVSSVAVILIMAMQSTQTYAFFCVILVAYMALWDWKSRKRQIVQFLMIAFCVLGFSTVSYAVGLQERAGYRIGEGSIAALLNSPGRIMLSALNPVSYWSAFKLWTYPYPLSGVRPMGESARQLLALAIMGLWLGLVASCLVMEQKGTAHADRRASAWKWLAVLLCYLLAAFPVVADSPTQIIDHRPHIALVLTGLVCFVGAYALQALSARLSFFRSKTAHGLIAILVVFEALGAQSGVMRKIVLANARSLNFIRASLATRVPADYDLVIVVVDDQQICTREPCGHWFQDAVIKKGYHNDAVYRYALSTLGIDPASKRIRLVDALPTRVPANAVVVDWSTYVRSIPP